MSKKKKVGVIVAMVVLFSLLLFIMLRFPGSWARYIWPLPKKESSISHWDYWKEIGQTDPFPCALAQYAKKPENRNTGGRFIRILFDLETTLAGEVLDGGDPSSKILGTSIPAIPPFAFGESKAVPKDHPVLRIPGMSCESMNKLTWIKKLPHEEQEQRLNQCKSSPYKTWETETECRAIAYANPQPLPKKPTEDDDFGFNFAYVRVVCPYAGIEGKWILFEKPVAYHIESGELVGGSGVWSQSCLSLDPLLLLNLPPPWISTCAVKDCIPVQRSELATDKLPDWPIYVEEKGELRKATTADLPYLKEGLFRIPFQK